jgi:acyl-CoA thioester hydrolase
MPYAETYRAVVAPGQCDHLGHMNVAQYFAACSDAVFSLQAALGLTRADVATGRRLSFAVVRAESQFHSEVLVGETIVMQSGVVEIGTKSALFHHRLFSADDGRLTFEATFRSALLDLDARKAAPVPEDVRRAADAFKVDAPS